MVRGLVNVSLKDTSPTASSKNFTTYLPRSLLSFLIPMSHDILGDSLPDGDEIDKTDTLKPWLPYTDEADGLYLT